MRKSIKYVGMDVHKKTIDIAIAEEGRDGEVRHYGTLSNDQDFIAKIIRKLTSSGCELRFVYEAGPCWILADCWLTLNGFSDAGWIS